MFRTIRATAFIVALSLSVAAAAADERPSALNEEALAPVRAAAHDLAREVEYLQEDIVTESGGEKERVLYARADAVLGDIDCFAASLKPGATREELGKHFDALDKKLHELLKSAHAFRPDDRLLRRTADRAGAADERLHLALFAADGSEARKRQLLERQAGALAASAAEADRTARYALGPAAGGAVLAADLGKLAEAARQFRKGVAGGADREQLRRDFEAVNRAWSRAVGGLKDLKPRENVHLLRGATRLDALHERLFKMLGLEGERPRLIIRT